MKYTDEDILLVENFINRIKSDKELLEHYSKLLKWTPEEKEMFYEAYNVLDKVINKINKAETKSDLKKILDINSIIKGGDLSSWEKERLETNRLLSLIRE